MPPSDWAVGKAAEAGGGGMFLIDDWRERDRPTVGGAAPEPVVLASLGKQGSKGLPQASASAPPAGSC